MNMNPPLSQNHPLRTEPLKAWPYEVYVAYRKPGSRKLTKHHRFYVKARGEAAALNAGMRIAREFGSLKHEGARLIPSRPVSARPLDLQDVIGAEL
ncbi:hypothetical protein [Pseudohongiella sp. O18]|uniref:hypothetical protein n=1 Tax=Pseudohongiella sp. O18 TaxID=2904248 RepID=UPI001F24609E|nr:hypothetical protein [Pseudohongiella sp. O18]